MKELVKTLKEYYADADRNIFNSMHNVKLDKVINFFYEDKANVFLDKY